MIAVVALIIFAAQQTSAWASPYIVPLGALLVSLGTLVWSAFSMRRQTKADLTVQLYARIEQLEREILAVEKHAEALREKCTELERQVRTLREENLDLMKKLLQIDSDPSDGDRRNRG